MQFSLAALIALLPATAMAHGYLCTPPPRGIEKESYQIDDLKSPNFSKKICRGEGPGAVHAVEAGGAITLDFKITAPHTGPCEVHLLDLDLDVSNQILVAEKYDCAAVGKVAPWTVQMPKGVSGRKVLRWYWEGRHQGTPGEPYEQCVDLQIGQGDRDDYATAAAQADGDDEEKDAPRKPVPSAKRRRAPSYQPEAAYQPEHGYGGERAYQGAESADDKDYSDDEAPAYGQYSDDEEEEENSAYEPEQDYDSERTYGSAESDNDDEEESAYGNEEPAHDSQDGDYGSSCPHGQYECNDDGSFAICNNNVWHQQSCGTGQTCAPSNGSILCVLSSQPDGGY